MDPALLAYSRQLFSAKVIDAGEIPSVPPALVTNYSAALLNMLASVISEVAVAYKNRGLWYDNECIQ